MPTKQGSIRLFSLFGIDVYLHWAWIFAVMYFVEMAKGYTSPIWSILECLALFLIVLMHEFGHQLACRSVGGKTHDIILWPLGGVAYVSPPQRPGAQLWSIVAGPMVNVMLIPILSVFYMLGRNLAGPDTTPEWLEFLYYIQLINGLLLVFNLLPIYPLDGGQILRSLLWFVFGQARSLMISTVIGIVAIVAIIPILIIKHQTWYFILAAFALINCWGGLKQALAMSRMAKAPRREGFACPNCHKPPPVGAILRCGKCRQPFDIFASQGICHNCGTQYTAAPCMECGEIRPLAEWMTTPPAAPPTSQ
jgi:Zn-dependent protease